MKKIIIILLLAAVGLSIAGNYYYRKKTHTSEQNNNQVAQQEQKQETPPQEVPPEPSTNVKTYTMEEVRKHGPESWDNGDSTPLCWMVIHGKIYEIPDSFTETHPGGHVIYDGCGTDATTYFETRPQGSGTPHSANARSILEKYYIGDLKN